MFFEDLVDRPLRAVPEPIIDAVRCSSGARKMSF